MLQCPCNLYFARGYKIDYAEDSTITINGEKRDMNEAETAFAGRLKEYEKRFDDAMDDDLNTADALGAIFELVKDANVTLQDNASAAAAEAALNSLNALCGVLGLLSKGNK